MPFRPCYLGAMSLRPYSPNRPFCSLRIARRRLPQLWIAGILLSAALLWPLPRARAYEDQLTVGVAPGYAVRFSEERTGHYAVLGLSSSLGLDQTWSARARLGYAIEPVSEPVHLFLASADIIYLVDVLQIVPYLGVGIDGIGTLTGSIFDTDAGIHAVLGLDYLYSRTVILGLEIGPLLVISDGGGWPLYLSANTKINFIFDL